MLIDTQGNASLDKGQVGVLIIVIVLSLVYSNARIQKEHRLMEMDRSTDSWSGMVGLVARAGVVVLIASGAGLTYNAWSGNGISLKTPAYPTVPERVDWRLHLLDMRMTLADAKRAFDEKQAVFLDARSGGAYAAGHIPGALNLPPAQVESRGEMVLANISKDAPIVTYCSGGSCQLSIALAVHLAEQKGFTNVHVFFNGWHAWAEAGYPTHMGTEP